MRERHFGVLLEARFASSHFVCVGLDPLMEKIPIIKRGRGNYPALINFNAGIIDATYDLVCAFKLNLAFYLRYGEDGLRALRKTIDYIRFVAPHLPVILDAKFGDIGKSNEGYAYAAFEYLPADAVTVNPYVGQEALAPFLDRPDRGVIILCRTSNSGSGEFQALHTLTLDPRDKPPGLTAEQWLHKLCQNSMQLYERIARNVANEWNKNANCQLVVGATFPVQAKVIRRTVADVPFLIPGVGTQGGDVEATVLASLDSRDMGIMVNSSSGIIFSDDPRAETAKLHDAINRCRKAAQMERSS